MELSVDITREQIERLIDDPGTELVIYYSAVQAYPGVDGDEGFKVIVRIAEEVVENSTVH
jgi:hypothetical protein